MKGTLSDRGAPVVAGDAAAPPRSGIGDDAFRALYEIFSAHRVGFSGQMQLLLALGLHRLELSIGMLTRASGDRLEIVEAVAPPSRRFERGQLLALPQVFCPEVLAINAPLAVDHVSHSRWSEHAGLAALGVECYLGAPVTVGDQTYGTLSFAGLAPRRPPFRAIERDFLSLMARWVGDELDRRQAEVALCEGSRLAALTAEISLAAIQSDTLNTMLQACVEGLVKQLGAGLARVWTVAEGSDVLELQASAGLDTQINGADARVRIGERSIGRIAELRRPFVSNGLANRSERRDRERTPCDDMTSFAGYPLIVDDRVVGVVAIFSRDPFSPSVLQVLASVSNVIGLAIARRRTQDELAAHREHLAELVEERTASLADTTFKLKKEVAERRRADERVAAFSSLAHELNSARDLRAAAQLIAGAADRLLGWDAFTVGEYSLEQDSIKAILTFDVIDGQRAEVDPLYDRRAPSPLVRTAMDKGAHLLLRDRPEQPSVGLMPFGDAARPSASLMFVPIRNGTQIIGVLSIQSYAPDAYTTEDLATLQSLTDQCGGAMERLRAAEALRESEDKWRSLVQNAPEIIFTLDREARITFINRTVTPYRLDAVIGTSVYDYLEPSQQAIVRHHFERVLQTAAPSIYEIEGPVGEGRTGWYRCHMGAIQREGQVVSMIVAATDITDRKRAEDALRREQKLFVGGPAVVFRWKNRPGWPVEYVSPNVTQFGYDPADFVGGRISYASIVDRRDLERVAAEVASYSDSGATSFEQDYRIVRPDGEVRWLYDHTVVVRNDAGRITHFEGYVLDITERKLAERALERQRAFLRQVIDLNPNFIFAKDRDGRFTLVNQAVADVYGTTVENLIGKTDADFNPNAAEVAFFRRIDNEVIATGREHVIPEETVTDTAGRAHKLQTVKRPILDERGVATHVLGVATDITAIRQADRAVRESETKLRAIIENTTDAIFIKDCEGRYILMNPAGARLLGRSVDEILGRTVRELLPAEDCAAIEALDRRIIAEGVTETFQESGVNAGVLRTYLSTKFPYRTAAGETIGVIGVSRDITDLKHAEEQLRTSEARLRIVTSSLPVVLWSLDANLRFTLSMGSGLHELGLTANALVGKTLHEYVAGTPTGPAIIEHHQIALRGRPVAADIDIFGRTFAVSLAPLAGADGRSEGVVGVALDITERKQMEQRFRHAQKMEAVGILAAGIAHDFNNMLMVISGCIHLIQKGLGKSDKKRPLVEQVVEAADRAAQLTSQLLMFSRQRAVEVQRLDLRQVIGSMSDILKTVSGEKVHVNITLDDPLDVVQVDRAHLERAIVNLAVNARDAMPDGGALHIHVGGQRLAEPSGGVPAGHYVRITVRDTGEGLSAEAEKHLFEPFFSTKPVGKGTGLGLAIVHSFVEQSGGYVTYETRPGKGTTFHIYLPVAPPA